MMSKKRQETRKHLLNTVLDLLMEGGDTALRMADVAKAAGVTRQTVYDHFRARSDMLIAAIVHFGDSVDVEARLAASRAAQTGVDRIAAYTQALIDFYPEIYPLQRALTRMGEADQDAKAAWDNRLAAMKEGCAAAIAALERDGRLAPGMSVQRASDYYFVLLGIEAWAYCVQENGWSQAEYLAHLQAVTTTLFVAPQG